MDALYTNTFCPFVVDGVELREDLGAGSVASGSYLRDKGVRTEAQTFPGMCAGLSGWRMVSPHPVTRQYVEGYGYVNCYYAPVGYDHGEKRINYIRDLIFYEHHTSKEYQDLSPAWNDDLNAAPKIVAIGTMDINSDMSDLMASRVEPLKKGSSIQPLYPAYRADTWGSYDYFLDTSREPYICEEDGDLPLWTLFGGVSSNGVCLPGGSVCIGRCPPVGLAVCQSPAYL